MDKKKLTRLILAGIIIYTVIVYSPCLNNTPCNDDFSWMRNCLREKECSSIADMVWKSFDFTGKTHFYRPLSEIIFTILTIMYNTNQWLYHVTSLVLHVINGILVYVFIKKLSGNATMGLVASFLFLVHSATNETVYWISGLITLLVTIFYLLSLNMFMKLMKKKNVSPANIAMMGTLVVLALITKEIAITLPVMLFLVAMFFPRGKGSMKNIFFVVVVICLIYVNIQYHVERKNYLVTENIYKPGFHFVKNIVVFHFVLLFPKVINSVYSKNMLYLVPTGVLSIMLVVFGNRLTRFLVLWSWITLLPASFFEYKSYITSRYMYIPSIGFAGILAQGITESWRRWKTSSVLRTGIILIASMIAVFYSYKTFFNDLYFEAKAKRYEIMYDEIKSRYPVIPDHTVLFLVGFPALEVHLNAMMKVWENPTLETYESFKLEKFKQGSIVLYKVGDKIHDFSNSIDRDKREIIFGIDSTKLFLKRGWTRNTVDPGTKITMNWINGKNAVCLAPIWENKRYMLYLKMKYVPGGKNQVGQLGIRLNNKIISTLELVPGWKDYEVRIPRTASRYGYNQLKFVPMDGSVEQKQLNGNLPRRLVKRSKYAVAYVKFLPMKPLLPVVKESQLPVPRHD